MKTQLGLGEATLRESVDPAIDHTLADPSGRASAPLVGAARAAAGDPERGDSIGRFVVLGVLGAGGMGVVYSAYDPHLDRKVAIKLLAHTAMQSAADASIRLLREAQAMAKINHPNVVKVHEVGTYREQIYLAMEFADAGTLRGWLRDADRSIGDILAVFSAAGRGLGAAHAVGLVHRDFKPDNVLLSKDGAVLVTDFGLVSSINAVTRAPSEPMPSLELSNTTPLSQDLTRTGSIMGTPTYMAPEQFAGQPSTARADQFSFCVALYEALYRERPFAGANYTELSVSVLTGEILPPPSGSKVPTWIRRVLVRGLATKPEDRHGSMGELLAALARDPGRRMRRIVWSGVGAVVGAAVIGGAVMLMNRGPECGTGEDRIAAVWSDAARAQISQAFMASKRPNAKPSFDRTSQIVDDWNTSWKLGYVDACRATRVRGEQSSHVLDLRMQCLTRRLDDVRVTLDLLGKGGGDAVDHALDAVLALPSVAPCSDAAGLTAAVPPPETEAIRALVSAAREQLGTARAQRKLGRYKDGLATAQAALVAARATSYPPVVAEALIVVGTLQSDLADPASSATLAEAMHVATAAGDSVAAIDASAWRMFELTQTNHYELAQEVGELADAEVTHARPPADVVVRLDNTSGLLLAKRGQPKAAQARYEQALAFAQRELGFEHPAVLSTLNQLGNLYKQEGRFDDARKALEQVVAIRERVVGKDHPDFASALNNLGNVYRIEGKLDDAKKLYDRALAIRIAALGPDHPEVGTSLNNLGTFYSESGDEVTAQTYFEKALALWERAYGKDSVELTAAIANLGGSLNARGDHEGARAQYLRAKQLIEAAHGPDHPDLASVLTDLGVVAVDEHKYDEALALYQRAQQITEKAYGPDHPDVADAMANITSVYKALGKLSAAEEMTGRTITVIAKAYGPDHPRMGGVLINYGALQMEQDKYAAALATYQKALAILEAKLGKDHPYVAYASLGIGVALVELKRPAEAVPYEERALAIRIATNQPPELLAETHYSLAEALVHDPRTTARAITEAKTSLGEYETAKDDHDAGEVRAWLHKHH
ncbi:MAG: tetratricopeptide repeat protein [Kofleriaceae bacterium]